MGAWTAFACLGGTADTVPAAAGKLYRKHYFRAYLAQGAAELALDTSDSLPAHTWPLGPATDLQVSAAFIVPASTPVGSYELRLAVVDQSGNPAMNLAISGKDISDPDDYGKYVLGNLYVQ